MACFIGLLWLIAAVAMWAFSEELETIRQTIRGWYGKAVKPAKKPIKIEHLK
jgi:hypothetical protein